ncbi:GlxA family transcriptional regulator [Ruegeria arenilitoris]|uniref:GlxA family transcriptional regulator n=1 Tax=Ruegeria arenilitoris TaxID=1173585 RepID=UPI0014810E4E|nr:helix-turn-helix domain-containing protein [Ruegeria arenilitoris]
MKSAKSILEPEHRALKTAVFVLDECNTLSFASVVDPMRAANRLADHPVFDWDYVTPTPEVVMLTSALPVQGVPLARLRRCDLLIVIAGFQIARQAKPSLLAGLQRIADTGATLAGIDGGQWLMAEAGLLDGHAATPRLEDQAPFAARFPLVEISTDPFTISPGRLTSSGSIATINLVVKILAARLGAGFASRVSAVFQQDIAIKPKQTVAQVGAENLNTTLTARANILMQSALSDPLPLAEIATALSTSPRSLQQQFRLRYNTTPQDHYLQLRLAEARRLVTDSQMPLMDVAQATGFSSQSSFARAFRTAHGVSARDLRQESNQPMPH